MKYGIRIETYQVAGRFVHKVYDCNIDSNRLGEISQDVVEAQKNVNEKLWDELPDGTDRLTSVLEYKLPKSKQKKH